MAVTYRALPQFGLPFVTPEDPQFEALARAIPISPFGGNLEEIPPEAVVVVNQSDTAVLAMSFLWKWQDGEGRTRQHAMRGLQSLTQLNWTPEKSNSTGNWFHPFLPGSKRLVTTQGALGNNSDVLPPEARPPGL